MCPHTVSRSPENRYVKVTARSGRGDVTLTV